MSGDVLVVIPHGALPADGYLAAGCRIVEWHVPEDILRALAGLDASVSGAVLMADGLPEGSLAQIIEAVRACGAPVVEVRSEQWDGFTPSPLAAACKGVVSGFGIEGAWAAAEALRSS